MAKQYVGYKRGCNSKGLQMKTPEKANPKVSTARGMRRRERENKVHAHQWVKYVVAPSTSYHSARITNEERYYCKVHNIGRPNGGGHGARRGGGQRTGCGATCKSPK